MTVYGKRSSLNLSETTIDEDLRRNFGDRPQTYQGMELRRQLNGLGVTTSSEAAVRVPTYDGGIGDVERRLDDEVTRLRISETLKTIEEEKRLKRLETLMALNPARVIQRAFYATLAHQEPDVRVMFHGKYVEARIVADLMGDRLVHDEENRALFYGIPPEDTRHSKGKIIPRAPSETAE